MPLDKADIAQLGRLTVQRFPEESQYGANFFMLALGAAADAFPAWGTAPATRDRLLREFWPTEPWLASTVTSLAARNAAFSWTVEGGPRTSQAVQEMLQNADYGKGFDHFITRGSIDLYSQDNGWFIEVIRDGETPDSPVIGLAHLDAGKCVRTGNPYVPVLYTDRNGQQHKLQWFQVVNITDAPSPVETMYGMGLCAVSRVLKSAQVMRDIIVRNQEKLSGRFAGALHLVSGVSKKMIDDIFAAADEKDNSRGRSRYSPPIVAGTLDPNAKIGKETIELASLPDGYDQDGAMKWAIALLALGFMVEYQDLAPLPGGGLGTASQSQVLHMKARGKGPEMFRKLVEHALNFHVLPQNVNFRFTEEDLGAKTEDAEYRRRKAEGRKLDIESGVLTPSVARQIMVDDGDLRQDYLTMLEQEDEEAQRQADAIAQGQGETIGDEATDTGDTEGDETSDDEATETKQLRDGDYWAGPRTDLENALEEDMADVLGKVRRRVEARLRQEAEATV